eukprot:CAMPEP_0179154248 /NCGR_PEP_ID=MMETSP0796-20121207/75057_1 /TAXON_ID=73915 /ORGANISM="Pyrodinium bahamense, Strain pbaha01" /LENGTH=494 /DNA_ID=CAMNT_0020855603 /DNA_START=54 /DNA_END=1538 /DNA_ORIENTATION=+
MAISLIVPAVIAYSLHCEKLERAKRQQQVAQGKGSSDSRWRRGTRAAESAGLVELRDWQQAAELRGCPWSFDGCTSLQEALEHVWLPLVDEALGAALDALAAQLGAMRVARVSAIGSEEHYFAVVYTLLTGAELFGGAPLEHEVSLELSHEVGLSEKMNLDNGSPPSRSRVQSKAAAAEGGMHRKIWSRQLQGLRDLRLSLGGPPKAHELALPCLSPFYRIHDGFGSLLSTLDLPALLSDPDNAAAGSCYYVYPAQALRPVGRWRHLVKFVRVDHHCVACVDCRRREPGTVYVERGGRCILDDCPPLAFVVDTVRNLAFGPPNPRSSCGVPRPRAPAGRDEDRGAARAPLGMTAGRVEAHGGPPGGLEEPLVASESPPQEPRTDLPRGGQGLQERQRPAAARPPEPPEVAPEPEPPQRQRGKWYQRMRHLEEELEECRRQIALLDEEEEEAILAPPADAGSSCPVLAPLEDASGGSHPASPHEARNAVLSALSL